MTILETVAIETVQAHEQQTGANVRLGGYHMDVICPTKAFQLFRATLDESDLGRLLLLGIPEFAVCTVRGSWRMADLLPNAAIVPRVASFIKDKVELPSRADLALLIVAADAHSGPIIIIDGNHRAMAHYATHKSIQGIPAFVCTHAKIRGWSFVPPSARVAL
jgi:hypothetical protein